jgi:hypothetical protein
MLLLAEFIARRTKAPLIMQSESGIAIGGSGGGGGGGASSTL